MSLEFQPYNPETRKFQRAKKQKPIQCTKPLDYLNQVDSQSREVTTPVCNNRESPPDIGLNLSSTQESATSIIPTATSSEQPEISRDSPRDNLLPPVPTEANILSGSEVANERTIDQSYDIVEPIDKLPTDAVPIPSAQTSHRASSDVILLSVQPKRKGKRPKVRYGLKDYRRSITKPSYTRSPKKGCNATVQRSIKPLGEGEGAKSCIVVLSSVPHPSSEQSQEATKTSSVAVDWEIEKLMGIELIDDIVHYLVCWKSTLVPECEIDFMRTQGEMDGEPMKDGVIDGVLHYLVRWKPTLVPEHEIDAPKLVRDFEAIVQGAVI
ncbi:hypothetical protein S7711_11462 [Stachybotrys chartarum IBT 7711]|uniref:Chromo shadow domain-containing protein n=1 Tax=Stachybotrys chartarum (strain CBS 109288 / IBT 7711) TaxID=1280523 RepID=A0A084B2W1_STACB|nr:hypothetical protein S7711_11462 [Stachybotrys chartarum IBT 7711]